MAAQDYNYILEKIEELVFQVKEIEAKVKKCDNTDLILLSEIAGTIVADVKRDILTKNISTYERDQLNRRFGEAKDYFADIQVMFDAGCSCSKRSKEEERAVVEKKMREIEERHGKKGAKEMEEIARRQLEESEIARRGR